MTKTGLSRRSSSDSDQGPDHPLVTPPNGTSKKQLFVSNQDRANKPWQQRSRINST